MASFGVWPPFGSMWSFTFASFAGAATVPTVPLSPGWLFVGLRPVAALTLMTDRSGCWPKAWTWPGLRRDLPGVAGEAG
jgi:hypothetical protein